MRRAEKLYAITGLPWGFYDLVEDMDEEEALDLLAKVKRRGWGYQELKNIVAARKHEEEG